MPSEKKNLGTPAVTETSEEKIATNPDAQQMLIDAIMTKDVHASAEKITAALEAGANPNISLTGKMTPLEIAIISNKCLPEHISLLVEKGGAPLNFTNGVTPIERALIAGNMEKFRSLVKTPFDHITYAVISTFFNKQFEKLMQQTVHHEEKEDDITHSHEIIMKHRKLLEMITASMFNSGDLPEEAASFAMAIQKRAKHVLKIENSEKMASPIYLQPALTTELLFYGFLTGIAINYMKESAEDSARKKAARKKLKKLFLLLTELLEEKSQFDDKVDQYIPPPAAKLAIPHPNYITLLYFHHMYKQLIKAINDPSIRNSTSLQMEQFDSQTKDLLNAIDTGYLIFNKLKEGHEACKIMIESEEATKNLFSNKLKGQDQKILALFRNMAYQLYHDALIENILEIKSMLVKISTFNNYENLVREKIPFPDAEEFNQIKKTIEEKLEIAYNEYLDAKLISDELIANELKHVSIHMTKTPRPTTEKNSTSPTAHENFFIAILNGATETDKILNVCERLKNNGRINADFVIHYAALKHQGDVIIELKQRTAPESIKQHNSSSITNKNQEKRKIEIGEKTNTETHEKIKLEIQDDLKSEYQPNPHAQTFFSRINPQTHKVGKARKTSTKNLATENTLEEKPDIIESPTKIQSVTIERVNQDGTTIKWRYPQAPGYLPLLRMNHSHANLPTFFIPSQQLAEDNPAIATQVSHIIETTSAGSKNKGIKYIRKGENEKFKDSILKVKLYGDLHDFRVLVREANLPEKASIVKVYPSNASIFIFESGDLYSKSKNKITQSYQPCSEAPAASEQSEDNITVNPKHGSAFTG